MYSRKTKCQSTHTHTLKRATAGLLRPASQMLFLQVSDKCLAHYVMYICFAANPLNLHPTLAPQCPRKHQTDMSFQLPQSGIEGWAGGIQFSWAWFPAWLCASESLAGRGAAGSRSRPAVIAVSTSASACTEALRTNHYFIIYAFILLTIITNFIAFCFQPSKNTLIHTAIKWIWNFWTFGNEKQDGFRRWTNSWLMVQSLPWRPLWHHIRLIYSAYV